MAPPGCTRSGCAKDLRGRTLSSCPGSPAGPCAQALRGLTHSTSPQPQEVGGMQSLTHGGKPALPSSCRDESGHRPPRGGRWGMSRRGQASAHPFTPPSGRHLSLLQPLAGVGGGLSASRKPHPGESRAFSFGRRGPFRHHCRPQDQTRCCFGPGLKGGWGGWLWVPGLGPHPGSNEEAPETKVQPPRSRNTCATYSH